MLTYVDWTPGRWGRVRTELLCPCGLPVLYLTARDVPARRVLRTLRRLRRAGDVRCAILPDALAPRAALCGIADPDEAELRRVLADCGYPACEKGAPGSNPLRNALKSALGRGPEG